MSISSPLFSTALPIVKADLTVVESSIKPDITCLIHSLYSFWFSAFSSKSLAFATMVYLLSLTGALTFLIAAPSDVRTMKRILGWIESQAYTRVYEPWQIIIVEKKVCTLFIILAGMTFVFVLFLYQCKLVKTLLRTCAKKSACAYSWRPTFSRKAEQILRAVCSILISLLSKCWTMAWIWAIYWFAYWGNLQMTVITNVPSAGIRNFISLLQLLRFPRID